ncbi:MAG TPA: hypothetical protein VFR28_01745 [Allosphingosinicella sp.]|jgi:hypothetical protein|nr:hypothetical protein [Allosphingosinicella sp.]
MDDKVYDTPGEVDAVDGKVVLDGPDGVAVQMTPAAAEETSDRLLFGAAKAQGQIVQMDGRPVGAAAASGPGPEETAAP